MTTSTPGPRPLGRGRRALTAAAAVGLGLLATAPVAAAAPRPADTVLKGGTIRTFDSRDSVVRALAIRDGRVVYAGTERGVRRYIGSGTAVQDLRGRTVLPGLQDAHLHVGWGGKQLVTCNLQYEALTVAQLQARIQACADADAEKGVPDTKFLEVVNWYRQAMKPAGTDATRTTLDAVRTNRPIVVNSSDGHTVLLSSKGLAATGITAATADPAGGRIARDASGQPTGILEDNAQGLATDKIPVPTAAENEQALGAALDALNRAGVTSVGPQQPEEPELKAYAALYRKGQLTARINAAPNISPEEAAPDPAKPVQAIVRLRDRYEIAFGSKPGIRVRAAGELYQDGVIQAPAQTASLLAPYFDASGAPTTNAGPDPYWPKALLTDVVVRLVRAGITPQVHAIGDRSVRETLDAYAAARKKVGTSARLSMSHAELVDPADYKRFKALDVTPVMSFQWGKPGPDSIEAAKAFVGPERFDRMEPEGRLQRAGARIAYGSDWPVDALNEFFAIEVGVTRQNDPSSGYTGRLNSDPGLTRRQAFRAITVNAAYEMGTERRTGSLESGKFADLIVVDRDPMKVAATKISDTKVLRTVVGGRTVYRAQ